MTDRNLNRRDFVKSAGLGTAGLFISGCADSGRGQAMSESPKKLSQAQKKARPQPALPDY